MVVLGVINLLCNIVLIVLVSWIIVKLRSLEPPNPFPDRPLNDTILSKKLDEMTGLIKELNKTTKSVPETYRSLGNWSDYRGFPKNEESASFKDDNGLTSAELKTKNAPNSVDIKMPNNESVNEVKSIKLNTRSVKSFNPEDDPFYVPLE